MADNEQLMRDALNAINALKAERDALLAEVAKLRGGKSPDVGDAISAVLRPQAEAVAKATVPVNARSGYHAGDSRAAVVTKRVEALAEPTDPNARDLTYRIRDRHQVREVQKQAEQRGRRPIVDRRGDIS